ncbi:MAG: S-layer homology domain-containing protein [Anaerovorax sp.]|nr:S-layer homology domain-containing protein [Anaerovorax sp.]
MKKTISFILVLMLVLAGSITAFADTSAEQSVPTDVKDTSYEAAVMNLMTKGILSGYQDGTFKPENTINRAEACTIIVKAMSPTTSAIEAVKGNNFSDMNGYSWASNYINYAAEKGIVSGYSDSKFKPGNNVTYAEMCTMLVNAMGYKATDLTGTWPDNYLNKASELDILKNITVDPAKSATRGNVALMTNAASDAIAKANSTQIAPTTPVTPTTPTPSAVDKKDAGKLKDYSGRATGMILSTAKVVNEKKESVDQIEFLMGDNTLYVNTDGKAKLPSPIAFDGSVYTLKLSNGIITEINQGGSGLKNFAELTTTGKWDKVAKRDERILTMENSSNLTVMKDAIFYKAKLSGTKIDEYKTATLSDITKDSIIRAYDVTDDKTANADIVVIVDADDASKL